MSIITLRKNVEKCLSEARYEDLDVLLGSEEARTLLGTNQSLYIIGILNEVHKIEKQNNINKTILYGRSMDEVVNVYKNLVLLLRRLEFNLEKELQLELLDYIKALNISVIGVWVVVQKTEYLYAKDVIIERFKNLF